MKPFSPATDADIVRARTDPAFRQKLLEQSLEALLGGLRDARNKPATTSTTPTQLREGVELAVRLAELIQNKTPSSRTA